MLKTARFHVAAALITAAVAVLPTHSARAEGIADVPLPAVQTHPLQPQQAVDLVTMPAINIDELMKEDTALNNDKEVAPRYAIPMAVKISPATAGTWEALDDSTSIWRLRIGSLGAVSLNFGFTGFHLPDGARLFIYSSDMRMIIRPFTSADNRDCRELWTPPVVGEEAVIELTVPNHLKRGVELVIGSINVGYREFAIPREFRKNSDDGGLASGACNIDVACPEGNPWHDQIPGVAVISTGGSRFCTGYMVNDTSGDRRNFFMTANHCGITAGNAASLVAFWNYQNSTCRPIGSAASGGPGDGSLAQFSTGATFRASFATSDFTLSEFNVAPDQVPASFAVSYLGWNRIAVNPPTGACIHHPNTDEKRISFYGGPTATHPSHGSSWGCSAFPGPGDDSHVKVYWTPGLGVTEPGSSGSPLFDDNHRVIGQLHGGPSACGATGENLADCYGRFSMSWTGGGSAATRLSDWLDAAATGATTTDTLVGGGINPTPTTGVTHVGIVGGPFTNNPTVYTLNNGTGVPSNYTVSILGGGTAPLLLNGGPGPVSGTAPASGSMPTVSVSLNASATGLAAGIYTTTVRFQDTTHNVTSDRVHTLEVGQIGYSTTPANGLTSGGPLGGPFSATQMYTLTSNHPTPVTVVVTASAPWISINGGPGPVNVPLNGNGATANVTIGFSAAANSLANGLYSGSVTFNALSGGTGSNTSRAVSLDVGRYTYAATGLPLAINDFSTITSTITVPDGYCITDVDLPIDITHTYIGDLVVDITSPGGTTVRLHNRTGGGTDNIVGTYDNGGVTMVPDGPGSMADFVGQNVGGAWTLTVSDQAGADTGTLNAWSLKIAAAPPGGCPQHVVVQNFSLDTNPGWTTQGQWAWGVPGGGAGGGHAPDPTSGFTGANVYGYNLGQSDGAYPNGLAPTQYLTTGAINLAGRTGTQLRFKRWLGVETSQFDHATVDVSNNGSTWTTVWANPAVSMDDGAWISQTIDISAVADNSSTVFIRWGMGTTDGSVTYCGWNIDDIQILAIALPCAGDTNADGFVNVNDLLAVVTHWGPCPGCPSDLNNDGTVNVNDLLAVVSHWGSCP